MLRARVSADRKADFNISADRVRHMQCITKTRLFIYIENFTTKNENFQMKNSGNFHISAQKNRFGYLLELHRRDDSNGYPLSV